MTGNTQEQFRKMSEGLSPKRRKSTWADNKLRAGLAPTNSDMANANSYGDGKTPYKHGKTFTK